jgi:hypothetical protein
MNHPRFTEPTIEQIAKRAAIERANWSDAEHYKRAGEIPPEEREWQPHRHQGRDVPEE